MNVFGKGFILGFATAVGTAAGCFYAFKKNVVDPIEEKEAMIDEHKKRAVRKMHAAQQG
ncbi:MAG: DUF3042 family protein [Liquorilactobacillus ghanensis]|jgi:hypothetical protein|uniref:DUF3042 domain-containing protein n=1 Tax=Liquorilactobacillus ghanensis DSM 18630 TaxID=1423750 RepID=A0A0R1VQ99_9LACO|nr:DUF3042 family protein [Liquorilactobacillus ghanensis]KRM07621.1 hypothetical protein FC89_GL000060 [Liquorilactobacillus ghanensis DSM 18630]